MKLSARGDYGMRAMLYLAHHYGRGLVRSGDIAAEQNIPDSYLNQLLALLRGKGLVSGTRGPQGGHMLARPAEHISVAEILEALEGQDALSSSEGNWPNGRCLSLHNLLNEIDQHTLHVLRGVSLAALAQRQSQLDSTPMYYI